MTLGKSLPFLHLSLLICTVLEWQGVTFIGLKGLHSQLSHAIIPGFPKTLRCGGAMEEVSSIHIPMKARGQALELRQEAYFLSLDWRLER